MELRRKFTLLSAVAAMVCAGALMTGCGKEDSAPSEKAAAAPAAQESEEKQVIKIAYIPITHAVPLLAAAERVNADPKKNYRIELVRYGSWPELLDALTTGRVDGASVLIEPAVKAKEKGLPLSLMALGHRNGNVIIGGPDQKIKGTTFAIPHRLSSHGILIHEFLEKKGVDEKDVNIVEMAPPEMPSALVSGKIGGYCVAEPFGAVAVHLGRGHVLMRDSELWPDSLCCGLVLNTRALAGRDALTEAFRKDYLAAGDYLAGHPQFAEDVAVKYLKQGKEVLQISLPLVTFDHLEVTPEAWGKLSDLMKKWKLSDNPPSYDDFVLKVNNEKSN